MKTHSSWNSFVPGTSKVDGFHGGLKPLMTEAAFANNDPGVFCGVTYRLMVNAAHNGWHHFLGMYTSIQGVAWANACVKENCRAGEYQFAFHFHRPHLKAYEDTVSNRYAHNSYKYSMFYGQDQAAAANYYGHNRYWNADHANITEPAWVTGEEQPMDLMVFRPTLVDPTNANNYKTLWSAGAYDGWQMYFTGFPLADPGIVQGEDYELS